MKPSLSQSRSILVRMRKITALQLDRFLDALGSLPPEIYAEWVRGLPSVPGGRDQVEASLSETRRGWDRLSAVLGVDSDNDGPEWLRLAALDAMLGWMEGESRTCMHSPVPDRPQPILAAAWKPGLIACIRCPHLLKENPLSNHVCDGCGRDFHPDKGREGIDLVFVKFSHLTYTAGACESCRNE